MFNSLREKLHVFVNEGIQGAHKICEHIMHATESEFTELKSDMGREYANFDARIKNVEDRLSLKSENFEARMRAIEAAVSKSYSETIVHVPIPACMEGSAPAKALQEMSK